MALFGLLPSKSSPAARTQTLVVVDWEFARRRGETFGFVETLKKPELWMVYQTLSQDERWKQLADRYRVKPLQAPNTERNLSIYLAAKLAHTLGGDHPYAEVVIVGSRSLYTGLADFLSLEGTPTRLAEGQRSERPQPETRERKPRPDGPQGRENRDNRESRDNRRKPDTRRGDKEPRPEGRPERTGEKLTWPEDQLRTYADKLAAFFERKYQLGEVYQRSYFGMAIKQATGKSTYEVFRTRNAGPYLAFLQNSGCVAVIEGEQWRLERHPTAEEFFALALKTTQRTSSPHGGRGERLAPPTSETSLSEDTSLEDPFGEELKTAAAPPAKPVAPEPDTEELVWDELK
ncbi:MAG: hypothetical protein SFY70_06205 [Bacteroidia bacterium]|nr:hypothetical protein [Bacteroidia bacterium]